MKLYYTKGACSLAVRIIINELGISCDYEAVDLRAKTTEKGANFLTINSKGAVPVLQLDNGELLTENTAIQQYLADRYEARQLLPPVGDFKRYRVLEWLNFIATDLHKGCSPLFNPNIPQQLKDEVFKPALKKHLHWLNAQLENNVYLSGDHFVLADAYLFVILTWLPHFNFKLSEFHHLERYFSAVSKRKSVMQSLGEETSH